MAEEIDALNQITGIIDQKAADFRERWYKIPKNSAKAERKVILDLIHNGLELAEKIKPKPADLVSDLKKLESDLKGLNI